MALFVVRLGLFELQFQIPQLNVKIRPFLLIFLLHPLVVGCFIAHSAIQVRSIKFEQEVSFSDRDPLINNAHQFKAMRVAHLGRADTDALLRFNQTRSCNNQREIEPLHRQKISFFGRGSHTERTIEPDACAEDRGENYQDNNPLLRHYRFASCAP
jgi:hypothetical protein